MYDLTNDKNEGILLKEKFYDENYDEKKIFRQTKSVILLTKLFSFNKKLVKYFKTWHKFILSESVQEILYILDNVKGEIDLLKIKNMFQIFLCKLTKYFQHFSIRVNWKNKRKTEISFLFKNILFMENFYNNKLLIYCKALQTIYNMKSKRKRYVFTRNNKDSNSVNLLANRIGTYFEMWKLKFTRLRKLMHLRYEPYLQLMCVLVILLY